MEDDNRTMRDREAARDEQLASLRRPEPTEAEKFASQLVADLAREEEEKRSRPSVLARLAKLETANRALLIWLLVLAFLAFGWPTLYHYERIRRGEREYVLVINRITATVYDVLGG